MGHQPETLETREFRFCLEGRLFRFCLEGPTSSAIEAVKTSPEQPSVLPPYSTHTSHEKGVKGEGGFGIQNLLTSPLTLPAHFISIIPISNCPAAIYLIYLYIRYACCWCSIIIIFFQRANDFRK